LLDGVELRTHFVSQAGNQRFNSRNATRKCPVSLPHRNMDDHALAAFAMLRAHAAEETNLQDGLKSDIRRMALGCKLVLLSDDQTQPHATTLK
jgi:hypothetical protein